MLNRGYLGQFMANILLTHSDSAVQDMVRLAVADIHTLVLADTDSSILQSIHDHSPDLIIVDATIPHHDSMNLIRQLRSTARFASTPILIIVNTRTAQEVAQLLDAGGDDCLRKPFIANELAARVRALLRRAERSIRRTSLILNPMNRSIQIGSRSVELTPTEYDLLDALCQSPGQHISVPTLLERVWHYPSGTGDPALVRNHVRNLRRKLESDPDRPRIVTCYQGRGYAISAEIKRTTVHSLS